MEELRLRSNQRIENTSLEFQRDELKNIDWDQRLMGIKGVRGIGKTTILLQHLNQTHSFNEKAIYILLDDINFTENKLITFVENFQRDGGQYLYLDEVHKYPNWSIEIKKIYDTYPYLRIAFTGSSMLNIHKGNADLSSRAIIFHMQSLSFRQYLNLKRGLEIPIYKLEYILENTNMLYSIAPTKINKGMLRKTFAINQLKSTHKVHYPEKGGNLLVNEKYVFEIGGKSKKSKQIIDIPNSYILADELDYKIGNKIPIWMVGLLY